MILIILITVSVTLWCLFSFALYAYYYVLEVILDLPLVGESPCSAHTALKLIIQKIIREANELPKLKGEGTTNTLEQSNRTYEDLLSTAILNKIISTSQSNLHLETPSSSRTNSVYSHRSSPSRRRRAEKEYFFGEETLDHKWKNIDTDTASVSSLEEWVHSDSSLGSTKYVDKVSLTIKQRIEEVTSSDSEQEENEENLQNDDIEYFRSNSSFSNDEPNWFLQKRQFRCGTSSPVPVPMLVPDPTTEAKVLIGDKEVDETSDLSDAASDFDEHEHEDQIGLMDVKNHLIETKCLIGGKNPLVDLSLGRLSDDEVSADSGVKECKDLDEVESVTLSNGRKHENDVAASIYSDSSIAERDTEYTEKYATLPRTILVSQKENRVQKEENNEYNRPDRSNNQMNVEEEDCNEDRQEEFTGVYSQREKEKWKHAVELKNNPYSRENIEKRIKSRNSINSLFGSDYYIKQACLPSGAKKSEEVNSIENKEENSTLIQEKSDGDDLESQIDTDVFSATKVYLDESNPPSLEKPEDENSTDATSLEQIDQDLIPSLEITSDSDVSLVNCYDVTQSVVYRKLSKDNNEEIQTAEQFLGFESLETYSNHGDTNSIEPEPAKPVAMPRKNLKSSTDVENNQEKIIISESEDKITKFKDTADNFDAVPYIIHRRSDNTLIRKIYSDPSVRSFALTNRSKLPIPVDPPIMKKSSPPRQLSPDKEVPKSPSTSEKVKPKENNGELENSIISEDFSMKYADIDCFYARAYAASRDKVSDDDDEREINKLKEQKLVTSILKKFSKSSINLSSISDDVLDKSFSSNLNKSKTTSVEIDNRSAHSLMDNEERSTSVKDLRKKFEQFDAKAKSEKAILYSLTGRSISKQFKERLREINNDSPSLSQIHSLSLTNLVVEENLR